MRTAGLALVLLLAAACGGQPEPAATPPPASPSPTEAAASGAVDAPPIEDAVALRDDLLAIAEANVEPDPGEGIVPSFGIYDAWQAAYPGLSFAGYAVPADEATVPVYSNLVNAKDVGGEDNPYILSFAVLDTGGGCAGGVIVGYPSPDTFEPVDGADLEECEPFRVASAGGYETFG